MKKRYVITAILLLGFEAGVNSQNNAVRELYYVDGSYSGSCGNIMLSEVLFFVSDTLSGKGTEYAIAGLCLDDSIFKKNYKYKLYLKREDALIHKYLLILPGLYEQFIKMPNHYYCRDVKEIK